MKKLMRMVLKRVKRMKRVKRRGLKKLKCLITKKRRRRRSQRPMRLQGSCSHLLHQLLRRFHLGLHLCRSRKKGFLRRAFENLI
jgi:hypothetical protein